MDPTEFAARLMPMKDKIFRFARSILSDVSEAEDATQDIYEKLWREHEKLEGVGNLDAFVMVSVRNLCYDRIRRRQSQERNINGLKAETPDSTMGFSPDNVDTKEILLRLMETLPAGQRAIIHLRDIEGYDIDDIASIVDMGAPTVRVLLSRARKSVRDRLIAMMEYGTK